MATYASSVYNYVGRRLSWSNNGAANAGPQRPSAQELSGSPPPSSPPPSPGLLFPPQQQPAGSSLRQTTTSTSTSIQLPQQAFTVDVEQQTERDVDDDDAGSDQTVVAVADIPEAMRAALPALGDPAFTQELVAGEGGGVGGGGGDGGGGGGGAGGETVDGVISSDAASAFGPPIMSLPEGSSQAQTMARRPSNSSTITTAAAAAAAAIPATTTTITPNEETPKTQALPEDDGQKELRSLLKGIYTLPVTEREKAQKMHAVMTERYHALKEKKGHPKTIYPPEKDDPFDVTPQDAEKSYHKDSELGCSHYKRGVKLQCSTCHKWHTCRFCHDEQEDHSLIRRETKNMLCMHCGKAQPAQQDCRHCGVKSARYYCDKCKLWDDDGQKKIYHCDDCGICRIGAGLGKDFFHCKKCGVCMSITLQDSHRCIERSTECDCPICGEFMFTSTMTVVFMPCGHSIHHKCYYEHMKSSYRCPTCARTIVNMESQFRALDIEISSQPLPAPYDNWRCLISCNDCSARSNVSFHFLGLKCEICRSYNTRQIRLIKPEEGGLLGGTSPPVFPVQLAQVGGGGGGAGGDGFGAANTTATRRDATGANTLIAATAAIVQADAAITMVSNSNGRSSSLVYDDGWDDEEGAREGVDGDGGDEDEDGGEDDDDDDERGSSGSWSRCGSDLGDSREEEEGEDDEEDDDFLNLTGHR